MSEQGQNLNSGSIGHLKDIDDNQSKGVVVEQPMLAKHNLTIAYQNLSISVQVCSLCFSL